jgi:stage V sporulation protein B
MDNTTLRKITVGSYYLMLDQIVNYGLGAVFWLLLAKLVPTSVIGQIFLINALTMAVLGFTGYGAQVTISKYIASYNAKKAYDISKRVFVIGVRVGVVVSGIAALLFGLLSGQLATSVYHDDTLASLIIVAMLAVLPTQTILSCFNGFYQGSQKMKYTALTDLIFQLSRMLIAVVLIFNGLGSFGIVLAFAFGSILAVAVGYGAFLRKLFVHKTITTEKQDLNHIIRFSGFNYLAVGISTLGMQASYLMLGSQNFDSVALFGISSLISGVVGGIIASVGKAILPTASEELEAGNTSDLNHALNLAFRLSLMISGFIYILLMISPDRVLGLLSHEYAAASDILRILVLSSILTSLSGFIGSMLNALGKPQSVAKAAIVSSVIVIGASVLLVNLIGLMGAAIATLAGSIISLSVMSYYIRKEKIVYISTSSVFRPVLAISVAIGLGFLASVFVSSVIEVMVIATIAYVILVKLSRVTTNSEIKMIFQYASKVITSR